MALNPPVFTVSNSEDIQCPILISAPHVGISFPEDSSIYEPPIVQSPTDTDWYVDKLYEPAASKHGLALIKANYSRYVVDLNRDPRGGLLYNDNRYQSSLLPIKTFDGRPIYKNFTPNKEFREQRLATFMKPYHAALRDMLDKMINSFGIAFLFEAHSIKRHVPSISEKPFPDMILGNNDGTSCDPSLFAIAKTHFAGRSFNVTYNDPFKGGYLTRHFGEPSKNYHSLQLEMSQDIYMNPSTLSWDPAKAPEIQESFIDLFGKIKKHLGTLKGVS